MPYAILSISIKSTTSIQEYSFENMVFPSDINCQNTIPHPFKLEIEHQTKTILSYNTSIRSKRRK